MGADLAGAGLAFLAGLFSILSPCVLPLLPIILGAAASEHKMGPAALALGVASSFVAIGLFLALIGFGAGIDGDALRFGAALLMIALGVLLAAPALQARLAAAGGPVADWIERRFAGLLRPMGCAANWGSACCSAPYGAPAPVRLWAPPRCSPLRVKISARSGW